jgi:hypothetical protein
MSRKETVTDTRGYPERSKNMFYGLPRDSISAAITASKGENADELERNAIRERLFLFFNMGKG